MKTCFICGDDTQWLYACEDVNEDGSKDCWKDYGMRKLASCDLDIVVEKLRAMPKDEMFFVMAMGNLDKLVTDYEEGG